MKKTFSLEELDCANCAAKMEEAIRKIDGVTYVSVSFMAQKLILECEEAQLEDILRQAQKEIRKIDRHCGINY